MYKTKTADANFGVTFKTKETQKAENSTTEENTSEQSSVQSENSSTSQDETSSDVNEDSSSENGDKVRLVYQGKNQFISLQHSLDRQNQELASLRDFLLPMLMNGQVTFKEDKE